MAFPSTRMYCSYRSILEGYSSLNIVFLMEFPHDEQSYFGIIVNWDYSLVNVQTLVLSIEGSPWFEKILHFSMTTHVVAVQLLKHKVSKPNSINSLMTLIIHVFFKGNKSHLLSNNTRFCRNLNLKSSCCVKDWDHKHKRLSHTM